MNECVPSINQLINQSSKQWINQIWDISNTTSSVILTSLPALPNYPSLEVELGNKKSDCVVHKISIIAHVLNKNGGGWGSKTIARKALVQSILISIAHHER